jgi:ABC-2 type transport system permease protein
MMDKLLLKFVHLFDGFFRTQSIDTGRMYAIVETKLIMDQRRVYLNWKQNQQQNESKNHLTGVLIVYALLGIFVGAIVFVFPSFVISMVVIHSYIIFMMAMTLITDFSTILLDTTDNQVLLPRPVGGRTLFMARMVHILIYLIQFTIALSLFPVIFTFVKFGIAAGIGICFTCLLGVLLAVCLTYLLYLLMLRFSSEQRLREIVTYFQIGMTVLFTVGFQIMARLSDLELAGVEFQIKWYSYLLPPVWMAMTLEAFHELNFDMVHLQMIGLTLAVPLILFWVLNKYLAPVFSKKIAAMSVDGHTRTNNTDTQGKKDISGILAPFFTRGQAERGAFEFVWKLTSRDRNFKLQFYPGMAYIVFFLFIIVFGGGRDMATKWETLHTTQRYLVLVYVALLSVTGSIAVYAFNENFMASWIYHSAPLKKPGLIITGGLKSLFVKFFIPCYIVLFAMGVYVWGTAVIDDFIFGFFNNMLCFFAIGASSKYFLPFSRQPNTQQQSGRFLQVLLQMLIMGALVGIHYLVTKNIWVMYGVEIVIIACCWLVIRYLRNLEWKKISV